MALEEPSSASGRPCTSSTSQSAQRVNPCRYSALHCGQNMIQRSRLHLEFHLGAPIGRTRCCLVFFLDLLFPIHYYNGRVNVPLECGVYAGSCRSRGAVLLFSGVFPFAAINRKCAV